MQIIEIEPTKIIVKEGLARYRTDMGDLTKLMESIQRTRQILPIVINNNYELIDGGRRVAACILGNMKVKAVFEDVIDLFEMRELELEANLHRKDYTPAEEALAIRDLHELRQKRLGSGGSGSSEGHSIKDTADLIGKSRGTVYNALELAAMVDSFPELRQAKKRSEIKKAAKGLEKLNSAMEGLKKHEATIKEGNLPYQLILADAVEHMQAMDSAYVDIILTDPIYGIGADLIAQTIGGQTGGELSTSGFKIKDEKDAAFLYYNILAKEGYRFTKPNCHGFIFVGPEHFWVLRELFMGYGWRVHIKPIIWTKRTVGQCNVPTAWPASCYEMLMYIRKDDSRLIKEGQPDWIPCLPVPEAERIHPYQKPVELLENLLERVALPGQVLYDPFCGSASSIVAGLKFKLQSIGVDNSKEANALATARLANLKKEEK